MDVQEASTRAKELVREVFNEESITNLGLEEVWRDKDAWRVTIGFSRPWNSVRDAVSIVSGQPLVKRSYKIVAIANDTGELISITDREKE